MRARGLSSGGGRGTTERGTRKSTSEREIGRGVRLANSGGPVCRHQGPDPPWAAMAEAYALGKGKYPKTAGSLGCPPLPRKRRETCGPFTPCDGWLRCGAAFARASWREVDCPWRLRPDRPHRWVAHG